MDKNFVWVVMGNDFPSAVFDNEKSADEYIEKRQSQKFEKGLEPRPRVYWRHYVFKLNEGES